MLAIQALLGYTGTGLSRLLGPVAHIYYFQIIRLRTSSELIMLKWAGLADPRLRHHDGNRVSDLKQRGRQLAYFLWGHSQGAIEAVFQMLRSELPPGVSIKAVFCLAGPFAGSPAAKLIRPFEIIPRRLRPLFEGIIEMKPGSNSLLHLQEKLKAAIEDPEFALPHVYLIAARHDHLVPVESAWYWPDEYPPELVHRVLLVHGEVDPIPGVTIIQVGWGMDHHVTMVWAHELHTYMAEQMAVTNRYLHLVPAAV